MHKNMYFQVGKIWLSQGRIEEIHGFAKSFNLECSPFKINHNRNSRLHSDICINCLSIGKQLGHAEKDCTNKKSRSKMTWGLSVTWAWQLPNVIKAKNVKNAKTLCLLKLSNQ